MKILIRYIILQNTIFKGGFIMAVLPPIMEWWNEEETAQQAIWDAGIVDAGSEGSATVFHVWNNRGRSEDVAHVINADLTVRDSSGGINDLRVAGQVEAVVRAQFFDKSKNSGAGAWGAINPATGVWEDNYWTELIHNNPKPIVACSGALRTLSGTANTADLETDIENYSKIKLKLYAKPDAGAGEIQWITRITYQYQ